MVFQAPFAASPMRVDEGWIDYNGHLNMAYYNVMFDTCVDEAFVLLGLGPEYVTRTNASFYTAEAHITYIRELHAGDRVRVTLQLLDYDGKRAHFFQELHHAGENFLSATCEQMALHVDMNAKKVAPFPEDVLQRIEAMYEAHSALPVAPQTGHVIAIPAKTSRKVRDGLAD